MFNQEVKKTVLFLLLINIISISLAVIIDAKTFEGFESHEKQKEGKIATIFKHLNLTEDQKTEIKRVQKDFNTKTKKIRKELGIKKKDLLQKIEDENTQKDKVKEIVMEIKVLRDALFDTRIESILSIKGILTQTQFKTFLKFKKEITKSRQSLHGLKSD